MRDLQSSKLLELLGLKERGGRRWTSSLIENWRGGWDEPTLVCGIYTSDLIFKIGLCSAEKYQEVRTVIRKMLYILFDYSVTTSKWQTIDFRGIGLPFTLRSCMSQIPPRTFLNYDLVPSNRVQ